MGSQSITHDWATKPSGSIVKLLYIPIIKNKNTSFIVVSLPLGINSFLNYQLIII